MHVLFIHPAFPAQFGQLAYFLSTRLHWRCTFITSIDTERFKQFNLPFTLLSYKVKKQELPALFQGQMHFQDRAEHMTAVYRGLRGTPQIKPDLVVGHTTFGSFLYLRNLYTCPFIGYFEWMPPPYLGDRVLFRKEFPPQEDAKLSSGTFHAFNYLQLHAADAIYTPTRYQLSTAPRELRNKITVLHDGIDAEFFKPRPVERPVTFRGLTIDKNTRVVTYVSPGLESMRGFDIFMKAAKKISQKMDNVIFLIAGEDRTNYGQELSYLPQGMSFKQWVLSQDTYDPAKFHFLGMIPAEDLAKLFNITDLHFYLTTPYVLSWSMIQAMASGCTILGSATTPVREVIEDGKQGLLADFYDVDGLAERALKVLKDPAAHKSLGEAARKRMLERYEAGHCMGHIAQFLQGNVGQVRDSLFANLGSGS